MPSTVLNIYCLESTSSLENSLVESADVEICKPLSKDRSASLLGDAIFAYGRSEPESIPWMEKAQKYFADVPEIISQSTRGVVLLRVAKRTYAVAFGPGGSLLIEPTKIVRGWGRRIALNLLYDQAGELVDNGRALRRGLRSQLGRGLSMDVHSNKEVPLDVLGFDYAQEILKSVTVAVTQKEWGRHVEGADSFRLRWNGLLSGLPALCAELESKYGLTHYQKHFQFIDDLRKIVDTQTVQDVWTEVARCIRVGEIEQLGLSPSTPVDLVDAEFAILGVAGQARRDGHSLAGFSLNDYRETLKSLRSLSRLAGAELKKQRIRAFSAERQLFEQTLQRLLDGVVVVGDMTYALNDGEVYAVSSRFIDELDNEIDQIDADAAEKLGLSSFRSVPMRPKKTKNGMVQVRDEQAFNIAVALGQRGLCMDGKNVITVPKRTDPVELCDVLMPGREFIHSKIGNESAMLSHLFAQASTSAELLLDSLEFRKQARQKVRTVAKAESVDHTEFDTTVPLTLTNGSQHIITLLIINREWDGGGQSKKPVKDVLPFFSKINLRSAVKRMRQRAFQVRIGRVPY